MKVVTCEPVRHSAAILAIFNEAIANSTAIYEYRSLGPDYMDKWFEAKGTGRYPVIGLENEQGVLAGFASYGKFRDRPAYKYTVEHSIYIDARCRGQGHGRVLLDALVAAAIEQDYHVMVGGIDASNAASIRFHERMGFTHCGTVKQVGFKFGRWLDLALYQKVLAAPALPIDG